MQHYPTNRAGHSPLQSVVEAFSPRHAKATGTRLDELDFVLAVADTDRIRFYILCVFITTDDSFPVGTILLNNATIVLHPTLNVPGYWYIDFNDHSIAPYALRALAARGAKAIRIPSTHVTVTTSKECGFHLPRVTYTVLYPLQFTEPTLRRFTIL